ncbi:MAG: GtrA family protein [Caldilineaceae bacterium]|nr:GtrA family protein [Caldilineaceae bacterium]
MNQALTYARGNREIKRFAKFALVGAAGSVTDFTVLNLLVQLLGFRPVFANTFSFAAAVIQNFALNRRWTFPESKQRQAGWQLAQFALISLVGLGINTLILAAVDHLLINFWIQWVGHEHLGFTISYNFAKLVAIGVVLFWNFAGNRLWTYRGLSAPLEINSD